MSRLTRTPLHRALHRPTLVLGGERELVLFTGLLTFGVAIVALTPIAFVTAALGWVGGLFALRRMAKADPAMSKVYLRAVKYRSYYAPRSTHWAED